MLHYDQGKRAGVTRELRNLMSLAARRPSGGNCVKTKDLAIQGGSRARRPPRPLSRLKGFCGALPVSGRPAQLQGREAGIVCPEEGALCSMQIL